MENKKKATKAVTILLKAPKPNPITELIKFVKEDDGTNYKEVQFGKIPNFKCKEINQQIGIKINELILTVTAHGIRHALKRHGVGEEDTTRQKEVIDSDFEHIENVLRNPDSIIKIDNSRRGNKALKFIKKIGSKEYHIIMSIENKSTKLVFNTMYIK